MWTYRFGPGLLQCSWGKCEAALHFISLYPNVNISIRSRHMPFLLYWHQYKTIITEPNTSASNHQAYHDSLSGFQRFLEEQALRYCHTKHCLA
jgi:hypothetical protein